MLTNITENSVSVLEVRDGENWRRAYTNSEDGRAQLQAEFPDAYEELCGEGKSWGMEPTVFPEPEPEDDGQAGTSGEQRTYEERIAELEEAMEMLLSGVTE